MHSETTSGPATAALPPAGIGLVADAGLRRTDAGRTLIGGSPLRIIRLSGAGAAVVTAWLEGTPLAAVKSARGLARRLLDAGMVHPVVVPMTDPPPVTVVVPAKDDADHLAHLLPSIGQPTLVVDDASDRPSEIESVGRVHGARVVRREVNGGPGAARMTGLGAVDTELVVFVDADVVLPDGWWPALAAHFDDPAVVAVAPRVRSAPGPSLRERYEEIHSPLDLGAEPANVAPRRRVAYVPTAVLAVRASAVDRVGGFDPALRVGEDVDLVWRLAAEAGTVRYAPEVVAHHRPRASWLGLLRQRHAYGGSAVDLSARHGRLVAPARCSRWSMTAWSVTAVGHPFVGTGIAAGAGVALAGKLSAVPDGSAEAARLAGWGHIQAGRGLASAISRVWWPFALGALTVRRLRPAVLAAMVGPAAWQWWRGERVADPIRSVGLRIADDMAYGSGVWRQVLRRTDGRALVPDLVEWPGGQAAVETATVAER
ncbi:MAG: mycofactocin biosynthesis glycosyltransferase MftF [Acidimicrobiales bacterium]